MSIIKVDYGNVSGGGDSVSGTLTTDSTTSKTYSIDTGLSSITEFMIYARNVSESSNQAIWWSSSDSTHFSYCSSSDGGSYAAGGAGNVGTNGARYGAINAQPSGGTIVLKTASSASWAQATWNWFAK